MSRSKEEPAGDSPTKYLQPIEPVWKHLVTKCLQPIEPVWKDDIIKPQTVDCVFAIVIRLDGTFGIDTDTELIPNKIEDRRHKNGKEKFAARIIVKTNSIFKHDLDNGIKTIVENLNPREVLKQALYHIGYRCDARYRIAGKHTTTIAPELIKKIYELVTKCNWSVKKILATEKTRTLYLYSTNTYYDYLKKHGDIPYLKIGDTQRLAQDRVAEQDSTSNPEPLIIIAQFEIPFKYRDKDIHKILRKKYHIEKTRTDKEREWFICDVDTVKEAKNDLILGIRRKENFSLRNEQEECVSKANDYFNSGKFEFLVNAVPRTGKTFIAYNIMLRQNAHNTLVISFHPSIKSEWKDGLDTHVLFEKYNYYDAKEFNALNPIKFSETNNVLYTSVQDILGKQKLLEDTNETNSSKRVYKLKWQAIIKQTNWDLVIFDEETAFDTMLIHQLMSELTYKKLILLSGTPFRQLMSGRFCEENIYTFSLQDAMKLKRAEALNNFIISNEYEYIPDILFCTIQLNSKLKEVMKEYNENEYPTMAKLFGAINRKMLLNDAAVQMWLDDLISPSTKTHHTLFGDNNISSSGCLKHMLWDLPGVDACYAMAEKLRSHPICTKNGYKVIIASDDNEGKGSDTLEIVQDVIARNDRTITLTCGKLTRGVTVPEWGTVFMLDDTESPQVWWQTALRCWSQDKQHNKQRCLVVDWNPNRTWSMMYKYCEYTRKKNQRTAESIREFLDSVQIIAYENEYEIKSDFYERIINEGIVISKKEYEDSKLHLCKIDDWFKQSINNVQAVKKIGSKIELNTSFLPKGKTYKSVKSTSSMTIKEKNDWNKKWVWIQTQIPTFIYKYWMKERIEDLTSLQNSKLIVEFETTFGISIDTFREIIKRGYIDTDRLNKDIERQFVAMNLLEESE
jgi:superfamily II DNA or RNA helicase